MTLRTKLIVACSGLLGLLLFAFIALRLLGVIGYFTTPTGANIPGIKVGSRLWALSFTKPKINEFICFENYDEMSGKKQMFIFRLVAKEGDVVEIKNGILYVNAQNADSNLLDEGVAENIIDIGDDSLVVLFATDAFISNHKITAAKMIYPIGREDEMITKQWHNKWNLDQFGPVTVRPGNYFVLGDNRHNAADSRYCGFIPVKDYKYTVLWK
jgi:signal peptidase I